MARCTVARLVAAGERNTHEWKDGEEPWIEVDKRGRFITNIAFADFVTAAVVSDDDRIKGRCVIILERGDKGTFDRGKLYHGQRQGVTFSLADALSWLLASRAQILDVLELEERGAMDAVAAEDLPATVQFLSDLCHVQAAQAAGEVSRICAELVFGYNRHPSWDEQEHRSCFLAAELDELEVTMAGIGAVAIDVLTNDGCHPLKAGPCASCHGSEEFLRLQSKLTTCLTGSPILCMGDHLLRLGKNLLLKDDAFELPWTPAFLHKDDGLILSIGQFNQWVGSQLMSSGLVQIWPGTPVAAPLITDTGVEGLRLADQGVDKNGAPSDGFTPGMDVRARLTVVGDGPVGQISRALNQNQGHAQHQEWAMGMKFVIELPESAANSGSSPSAPRPSCSRS